MIKKIYFSITLFAISFSCVASNVTLLPIQHYKRLFGINYPTSIDICLQIHKDKNGYGHFITSSSDDISKPTIEGTDLAVLPADECPELNDSHLTSIPLLHFLTSFRDYCLSFQKYNLTLYDRGSGNGRDRERVVIHKDELAKMAPHFKKIASETAKISKFRIPFTLQAHLSAQSKNTLTRLLFGRDTEMQDLLENKTVHKVHFHLSLGYFNASLDEFQNPDYVKKLSELVTSELDGLSLSHLLFNNVTIMGRKISLMGDNQLTQKLDNFHKDIALKGIWNYIIFEDADKAHPNQFKPHLSVLGCKFGTLEHTKEDIRNLISEALPEGGVKLTFDKIVLTTHKDNAVLLGNLNAKKIPYLEFKLRP